MLFRSFGSEMLFRTEEDAHSVENTNLNHIIYEAVQTNMAKKANKNRGKTKEEWLNMFNTDIAKNVLSSIPGANFDLRGVEYLSPVIDGYMVGPVGVYDGNIVEAKTVVFSDIQEALTEMVTNGDRIVMYMLIHIPGSVQYDKLNEDTFELEPLPEPVIRGPHWKMRFEIGRAHV